ncbi:Eukaryotic translation initiation factor 2-alpha kinase [Homalodisca vitripennis]|nr:Eukaryotic translation initiation factor 2-alpha kinase [Homalodisca vitripennis]
MKDDDSDWWSGLQTVSSFDNGLSSTVTCDSSEDVQQFCPSSLLVESLIGQLCKLIEKEPKHQKQLYLKICKKLHQMKLIDESYELEEFESMRSYYQKALYHLVSVAKTSKSPDKKAMVPKTNSLVCLKADAILEWSRYSTEFEELDFIARGGFGQVFRARHKLDGELYAVKKIYLRFVILRNAVVVVLDYCINNDLVLNKEKTKQLVFVTKKNEVAGINTVHTNYVGFIVDADLSWKNDVDINCKTLGISLYAVGRTVATDTAESPRVAYNALFESHVIENHFMGCQPRKGKERNKSIGWVGIRNSCRKTFQDMKILTVVSYYISAVISFAFANNFNLLLHGTALYSNATGFMQSLTEVKMLAKLNHPNIVAYKAAWLEPIDPSQRSKHVFHNMNNHIIDSSSEKQDSSGGIVFETSDANESIISEVNDNLAIVKPKPSSDAISTWNSTQFSNCPQEWACLYIQMQLCHVTLRQLLDDRNHSFEPVKETHCLALFKKIVQGVEYIHSQGIVHHDIKPSNIFLSRDQQQVQVGDFGLACPLLAHNPEVAVIPSTAHVHRGQLGTKLYAAPEQLNGICTPKTDDNDVDNYKLMMAGYGFEALVTQPTRVTATTRSCIDHVYLRMSCRDKRPSAVEAAVVEADVTDHYMTSLRLRLAGRPAAEPAAATCTVISYDKLDDPEIVADEFNDFFLSVAEHIIEDNSIPNGLENSQDKNNFVLVQERSSTLLGPSDIYSLGIVLMELIQPFQTDMERSKVIGKLKTGNIPPELSEFFPTLVRVIKRCIYHSPSKRPTAHELLELLEDEDNSNSARIIAEQHETIQRQEREIRELKRLLSELSSSPTECFSPSSQFL